MPTLRLKVDAFDRLTGERGLKHDAARARAIGVSHSTIGRIRRGQISPGERFIRLTLDYLDRPFEDLFDLDGRDG